MASFVTPKKNTAYECYVALVSQANTKIVQVSPTMAAGDVKVSTDNGTSSNITTLPVIGTNTRVLKVNLSASEMNGDNVTVIFSDAAGAEWCDLVLNIQTSARQVDDLATPTNITAGTITTVTNLTNLPAITANWLTAAGTAADFGAEMATAIWTDTTAGDFTVAASIGKSVMNGVALGTGLTINGYTGNTVQTGDSFSRIGVAGAGLTNIDLPNQTMDIVGNITGNLSGSVGSVTGAVGSVTGAVGSVTGAVGSVIGNVGGNVVGSVASVTAVVSADITKIGSDTTALTAFKQAVLGNVVGTVGAASTTTSIVTSSLTPAAAVIDQFKGRIVIFDKDTATANLRGQATDITASTALGVLTVTALTTAPANGDTFTIT